MDNPNGISNMIINEFLLENNLITEPQETEFDILSSYMEEMNEVAQDENFVIPDNN